MIALQGKTYKNNRFSHDLVKNRRKFTGIHYHDDYELYYMINGKTKFFIGDEIFQVENGNFVIISPDMYHMTDSEDCLHNERILIAFEEDDISENIKSILKNLCEKKVICISSAKLDVAEKIIKNIENEHKNSDENSSVLINLYIEELLVQMARLCRNYKPHLSESEEFIHSVSKYISTNYKNDLSLSSLSKKFSVSESHLSRRFKNVTGIGINEYITYVRIMNAEAMLKSKNLPITVIAEKCGFNDSNYFATVFKRIKGITPLKYANRYK